VRHPTQRDPRAARHIDIAQPSLPARSGTAFLNCPRCGLSIRRKSESMNIENCPRCLARAQLPVRLFVSARPTIEWYREGSAPYAERRDTARRAS
jgi:Zn-finger nucleic acid-binding protein